MKGKQPRAKDQLRNLQVTPRKERGQNFIIDSSVVRSIIEFGDVPRAGHIVEIGPGLGALTEALNSCSEQLSVIEIEPQFAAEISRRFPRIGVHRADARHFDFRSLGSSLTIFGNLPYSFSTEILFSLLDYPDVIIKAVLMLQREFAERVAAAPGSKAFGVLSVMTQMFCSARLGPVISGDSFHPPTQVESILLELLPLPEPRWPIPNRAALRQVVQGAFLQRRKKVRNSLKAAGIAPTIEILDAALHDAGIDGNQRAEQLTLSQFAALATALDRMKRPKHDVQEA
jgi:16S rRNA (adenine1518-N6/adenine1519-N6)-dimethyltransferase